MAPAPVRRGMTILVAGATGTTGSLVVRRLVDKGIGVRALTRSQQSAEALTASGVEAVVSALDDADATARAAQGVTAAYLATSSSPELPALEGAFARVLAAQGVPLVKLSVVGATTDSPLRFGRGHAESEAAIKAAYGDSRAWTFLRPNGFMQNDLAWAQQVPGGTIAAAGMDSAWSIVDANDIADVAVTVLTDPASFAGRSITITGPAALTPRERVAALGRVLGRDLTAVDVPLDGFAATLRGYGMSDWYVEALVELMQMYGTGAAAPVAPDAQEVLGRPLKTWEQFVSDHRQAFAG